MSAITIIHTLEEGTLATGDTRPHAATLKAHGWKWGRSITAWYLPSSRDKRPNTWKIDTTIAALKEAGCPVYADLSHEAPDPAQREANRAERLDDRQTALTAKAERKEAESAASFARVDGIAGMIPMGQPILVGHHSERHHRRDLDRIDRGMRAGIAAGKEADEAARRARASEYTERHRMSGPATLRRIEKLEADRRGVLRQMETAGDYQTIGRGRASEYLADLDAEIAYWRQHIESLALDGFKVWGPADFARGDYVQTRFGAKKIVRVNKKSLSVESGYSWTDTVTYDEVRGKIAAADLEAVAV